MIPDYRGRTVNPTLENQYNRLKTLRLETINMSNQSWPAIELRVLKTKTEDAAHERSTTRKPRYKKKKKKKHIPWTKNLHI